MYILFGDILYRCIYCLAIVIEVYILFDDSYSGVYTVW